MTQIMFETFNVPAMYVAIQAVLSLYGEFIAATEGSVGMKRRQFHCWVKRRGDPGRAVAVR